VDRDREQRILLPGVLVRREAAGHPAVLGLTAPAQNVEQRLAFPAEPVPDGFPAWRDLDDLRELARPADPEHFRPVADLRTIGERQLVEVPAVPFERVLIDERLPPRGDLRGAPLLDGQAVVDLAVELHPALRLNGRHRDGASDEQGDRQSLHWSYLYCAAC